MKAQQITTMDLVVAELEARRSSLQKALGIAVAPDEAGPHGDGGTHGETEHLVLYEQRQLSEAVATMMRAELEEATGALTRIEEGRYGTCQACDEVIPDERLLAVPSTPFCVRCGAHRSP